MQDIVGNDFHDVPLDSIRYEGSALDRTINGNRISFPGSFDRIDDTGFGGNDPKPSCPSPRVPATIVVRPDADCFCCDRKAHCCNAGDAGDVRGRADFADQVHSVFRLVDHSELPML
jgi:hypothetical protein